MADSGNRAIQQLFEQVFDEEQRATYANLSTYIQQDGSIFPLVERGVQGLVRDYGLSHEEAQAFLRRANSLAAYVRRQFIEHSLTGSGEQNGKLSIGLLSLVPGPSYERLFSPNFDQLCPPDALESVMSPVAYMVELLRWIQDRIEPLGTGTQLLLHNRRRDLKPLPVDFNAVHQSVSAVDIIVSVLEAFIQDETAAPDLEHAMIEARYPNGLPYYQHWVTLDTVARYHGLSVGNFDHMVDVSSPYFLQPEAWDSDAERALAHASRLGPYQRLLLTEEAVDEDGWERFYLRDFGAEGVSWTNLSQVAFFGERTKLDARGVEALLSVRDFAPTRSPNITVYEAPSTTGESHRSGSVYLNGGASPPVTINYSAAGGTFHRLSVDPATEFAVYDRMNRKLRLDQWLELPTEQVDALLVAAMKAENRDNANTWWITNGTVHALGLFQSLRERYGCTAPDFAAFIDEVGIYGRGTALSQFDQVFNNLGDYRAALVLDGLTFPIIPAPGATDLTINRLCSGLGIDLKTYEYLALAIARAHNRIDGNLLRTTAIISAFYRLVKLPRLLGITPVEGVLMLTLLGGETWVNGLAGTPSIKTNGSSDATPDALNLIYALQACVGWCRDRDLPVLWMLQQVSPPAALAVASEKERQLFEQAGNLLPAALFTHGALLMAGVPPLVGSDWLNLLTALVDSSGLVISRAGTEAEYLVFAREELDKAVRDGLGLDEEADAAEIKVIVERMLTVLLQAREAQASVVKETLAVYTGLDAERVAHVLVWANSTVYQLLRQVLEQAGRELQGTLRNEPDPSLTLLADVRRRANVVLQLDLSATLLQDYLQYGYKAWLGQDDRQAFSVRTLYYLTALTRAFELGEQPAGELLNYLREVNALPEPITDEALGLAQKAAAIRLATFFDWSAEEVRACITHIDPDTRLVKNLTQLDLLMRIRVLSRHTGMDALTIFRVGGLPETFNKDVYRIAAESALLSLTESGVSVAAYHDEVPEPIVTLTCTVDKTDVVANDLDDTITFTVTLTDPDGSVIPHVNVYWQASLGTIATQQTDEKGEVNAAYLGKVLGTETPLFWLDLMAPMYAPTINVIADKATLTVAQGDKSRVPDAPVPAGREVELYGTLTDQFGNLGKGELVRWNVSPIEGATIRPAQGFTNQDGLARAFISSAAGGTFVASLSIEGAESGVVFDSITFVGPGAE
ncbi:Tc toxin subunit A [Pseudomonas frederiksbergensis]|uniref:Tc toxin subunit A n=1 Tax=Pseudomonas frederiksbergensis TaxID=104087 RepID=UPI000F4934A9|nr:Tc toxin subunit A [Pseudomonas frederiksbergensis]RON43148.1 virulence plasmid 28 protein [Pseudomonas frederiksbergensis]